MCAPTHGGLVAPSIARRTPFAPGLRPSFPIAKNNLEVPIPAHPPHSATVPLLVILGPTGAGKSDLALMLAEAFQGEIVNCDSIQVYRGFEIGSAKLPVAERRGIPHHLLDVAGPDCELTAGAYSRLARTAISEIRQRRRTPIIVGGTGFYLRALLAGLSPAPLRDERLRTRLASLAKRRPAALHRFLHKYDPAAAARIHANDHQKLIRAIEIVCLTRSSASKTQQLPRDAMPGAQPFKIGLNPGRTALYQHLNQRCGAMFQHGLLEEVRALLAGGWKADAKPLQSLGYKQALKVLNGEDSLDEAIEECRLRTRQYAKRQMTWFRREPDVHWLAGFGSEGAVAREALRLCQEFLASYTDPEYLFPAG